MPIPCPNKTDKTWTRLLLKNGGDETRSYVEYFRSKLDSNGTVTKTVPKHPDLVAPDISSHDAEIKSLEDRIENLQETIKSNKWTGEDGLRRESEKLARANAKKDGLPKATDKYKKDARKEVLSQAIKESQEKLKSVEDDKKSVLDEHEAKKGETTTVKEAVKKEEKETPFADFLRTQNARDNLDPTKWSDKDYDAAEAYFQGNDLAIADLPKGKRTRIQNQKLEFQAQTPEGKAELESFEKQYVKTQKGQGTPNYQSDPRFKSRSGRQDTQGADIKYGPKPTEDHPFVYRLHDMVSTTSGGKTQFNGANLDADGRVSKQVWDSKTSNIPKSEKALYEALVPEAFRDGKVDVKMLDEHLAALPSLQVHTYGMSGKPNPDRMERDKLQHEWLDSMDNHKYQQWTHEHAAADDSSPVSSQHSEILDRLANLSNWNEQDLKNAKRYLELTRAISNNPHTDSGPRATSYYKQISPFDTEKYPVQRVDISIPQKEKSGLGFDDKKNVVHKGDKSLWEQDNLHENLPNTLGWAMVQVVPHPETGEPTMFVGELQSRWGQERAKDIQEWRTLGEKGEPPSDGSGDWTQSHPLLDNWETLTLKSVIDTARRRGIKKVIISDGESAMMTEGHDKAAHARYTNIEPGKWIITDTVGNNHNVGVFDTQDEARAAAKEAEKDGHLSNGWWSRQVKQEDLIAHVSQEGGMRQAYDKTAPRIMEKLTGDKGREVDMGVHKNAKQSESLEDGYGSPVFKTKQGLSRTNVGGKEYDISKVNGELSKYGPKDRAVREEQESLHDLITSDKSTVEDGLKLIAGMKNSVFNELAQDLLKTGDKGSLAALVKAKEYGSEDFTRSTYYPDSHEVHIGTGDTMSTQNFVHEAIHALTARKLNEEIGTSAPKGREYMKNLDSALHDPKVSEPVKDLIKAYRKAVDYLDNNKLVTTGGGEDKQAFANRYDKNTGGRGYGLTNLDEFMSESMSNSDFQELLNQIPGTGNKTVWQHFVDAIRKILGMDVNRGSLLEDAIKATRQITKLPNAEHYSSEPSFNKSSYNASHPEMPGFSEDEWRKNTERLVNEGAPREIIEANRYMGTVTDQAHIKQTILPMEQFAKESVWGSDKNPGVNLHNTVEATKAFANLSDPQYGAQFSQKFRDWSSQQGTSDLTGHTGDVVAAVLHAQLYKYARDAAAQKAPGAYELFMALQRRGTDGIVVNNILSATTAGRLLQVHSMASRDLGLSQGIKQLDTATDEAINQQFGGRKVAQIEKTTDSPSDEDISQVIDPHDKAAQDLANALDSQNEEAERYNKEADKMIERLYSTLNQSPPEDKATIISQLKELTSRYTDTPFSEFKQEIMSIGVSEHNAEKLQKLLDEMRGRYKGVEEYNRLKKLREAPQKAAERIVDQLDKKQTETQLPEKIKSKVRELSTTALKDQSINGTSSFHSTREEFIRKYSEGFKNLGVDDTTAYALASRLYSENMNRSNRLDVARMDRLVKGHGVKDLVKDMLSDPNFRNKTPDQMKDRSIEWLKKAGLTENSARKYVDKYQKLLESKMNEARVKAFDKATQGLKTIAPITMDKIRQSLRSGDPDAVRKALAEQAGFKGLSSDDVSRLAQLDIELEKAGPSERSVLLREMANTLQNASGEMSWGKRIYQSFVNSALSGLSTISLHYTQPAFATATRVGTEMAGILRDVGLGRIKPTEVPDKVGTLFNDFINSYKGYVNTLSRSYKNDAYSISFHKSLKDLESLGLDLTNQINTFKTGNFHQKANALTKIIFASTNISHKMLLSGIEANARTMQTFFTRRGARKLLGETLTDSEMGKLITEATKHGNDRAQEAIDSGLDQNRASGIAIDATNQYIRDAVDSHISGAGQELSDFVANETSMEIGSRRGEKGHTWDVFNHMVETAKNLANYSRRENPLVGRMLTGFVSVPANLVNRSLAFTPVGLMRAFAKSREIAGGKEPRLYLESMGNDLQLQQRYLEGVAGTVGALATAALFLSQDQEDPNYTGPRITLDGPKDRGLREAWLKRGNRPGSVEWVSGGQVKAAVNYARGGPESLKLPFVAIGALDDMRLNGTLGSDNVAENVGSWVKTMATGGMKQAAFFGLKNISDIPSLADQSDKSVASNLTWMGSGLVPWSGFVKSLTKMTQAPLDQSSVKSSIMAQIPFLSVYGREAVNALGDTKSEVDTSDRIDVYSDRAAHGGLPFYVAMGTPTVESSKTYAMFLDKGVSPVPPSRSQLQQRNGFVTDDKWEDYLKTRGRMIKDWVSRDYNYLRDTDSATFEKHLRQIEADSTKGAKKKLGLK